MAYGPINCYEILPICLEQKGSELGAGQGERQHLPEPDNDMLKQHLYMQDKMEIKGKQGTSELCW